MANPKIQVLKYVHLGERRLAIYDGVCEPRYF